MVLRIECLNHASVLLEEGELALLCDPWFEGGAFSDGWGLQYENPDAWAAAQRATHLWISHWHSDHLHAPTLEKLAARSPGLRVLSNHSANFSMAERMRSLGFGNIAALRERVPLTLGAGVRVERFPTAGIDNALLLRTPRFTVLNYNDCNLPIAALSALMRHIGPVDVLLTNYNHAGKLFQHRPAAQVKAAQFDALRRVVDAVDPRLVIPFASSHYYRAPDSLGQNASLLSFDELEARTARDERFCVLRIGDRLELEPRCAERRRTARQPALEPAAQVPCDYGPSLPQAELIEMGRAHAARLRHGFALFAWLTEPLTVAVRDLGIQLRLDCRRGRCELDRGPAHISAHSQALRYLLGRRFGADTFIAGTHFAIEDPDTRVIERWGLLALLDASHMTERDALRYLGSADGRRFLWCRREEIVATLSSGQVKAGQLRV